MKVNLLLANDVWTRPLNQYGVRQHVSALYEEVFFGCDSLNIFPKSRSKNLFVDTLRHLPIALAGDVTILCPGYPVVVGALASWGRRHTKFVVHTWKFPNALADSLSAKIYDSLLSRVIRRAHTVVVPSMLQKSLLEAQGLACPVLFAPVSVDSHFWHPDPVDGEYILSRYGLTRNAYVLTVGGSDRDEIYAAQLSRILRLRYVRATYSPLRATHAASELKRANLHEDALILVKSTDVELRALYAGAWVVCLPTVTRTNPAGLTSLVEGMACGAVVAAPESITEGYLDDQDTGFVLRATPDELATTLIGQGEDLLRVKSKARKFAETELNNSIVASRVKGQLRKALEWV